MIVYYFFLYFFVAVVSYGFIDPNLSLSTHPWIIAFIKPLFYMVYYQRPVTAGIFFSIVVIQFFLFKHLLEHAKDEFPTIQSFGKWIIAFMFILVLSYPMLSYDLFNYITTAKVTFTHRENPYIVMPIEIPNDPNLAFTRAANKLALYGPTWLLLTWIPHVLGMGRVWQTIITFKALTALWYAGFCYMLWRVTKNLKNVLFFALNPLVLTETLVSGHNDIVMMVLACGGLLIFQKRAWLHRVLGICLFLLSVCIKGATVALVPLFFLKKFSRDQIFFFASLLLLFIFFTVAPIREELYPWYAIWFLSFAAFLPYPRYAWFWQFCIVLSLGLELRHVPYMAMGYYEGPGPLLRTVLTVIPAVVWGGWILWQKSDSS